MTQEFEFFKDFAGVTKADLEMFKCGGKKKMAEGGTASNPKKKLQNKAPQRQTNTYVPSTDEGQADSLYIGKDRGRNHMTRQLNTGNMKMMYTKNGKPSTAAEWNKNMKNAKTRRTK